MKVIKVLLRSDQLMLIIGQTIMLLTEEEAELTQRKLREGRNSLNKNKLRGARDHYKRSVNANSTRS